MSNTSYSKRFTERMNTLKKSVISPELAEILEMRNIRNKRIQEVVSTIEAVTKKKVREQFSFRSGWVFGIMNHIAQNPTNRTELLMQTGLDQTIVDLYMQYAGYLPYINKDGIVVRGKDMIPDKCKELIQYIALQLGWFYEDEELEDINTEHWNYLKGVRLKEIENTLDMEVNTQYDE